MKWNQIDSIKLWFRKFNKSDEAFSWGIEDSNTFIIFDEYLYIFIHVSFLVPIYILVDSPDYADIAPKTSLNLLY